MLPADGSNGIPDTLTGIWWTDARTIHYVISFKNVVWNPSTRTANLLLKGPGMYSVAPEGHFKFNPNGIEVVEFGNLFGYDIIFNPDLTRGEVLVASSDTNGNRHVQAESDDTYYMTYDSDGLWIRHTPGEPDYKLRRIVKADGTRDTAYADYLAAMPSMLEVDLPAQVINSVNPSQTFNLNAGDVDTYVGFVNQNGGPCEKRCVVTWKATAGVTVTHIPLDTWCRLGGGSPSYGRLRRLANIRTARCSMIVLKT